MYQPPADEAGHPAGSGISVSKPAGWPARLIFRGPNVTESERWEGNVFRKICVFILWSVVSVALFNTVSFFSVINTWLFYVEGEKKTSWCRTRVYWFELCRGLSSGKMAEFQWCPLRFPDFYKSVIGKLFSYISSPLWSFLVPLMTIIYSKNLLYKSLNMSVGLIRGLDTLPEAQQCPICCYLEKLSAQQAPVLNTDL